MTFAIRYPDDDPYGRGGAVVGEFDSRDEAEEVLRAMPSRVEVVEIVAVTAEHAGGCNSMCGVDGHFLIGAES